MEKYKDHPQCIIADRLLPVLTNQKMNAYLREIADLCGIQKNFTFHIARHTFATTVTLSNGVPIETVSKMLGHKNLRTPQHYAKIMDRKVRDDMQALKLKLPYRQCKNCSQFKSWHRFVPAIFYIYKFNLMQTGEIIIYQTEDGQTSIDVKLQNETVWLTQGQIVALFKSSKANISEHITHIFEANELDEISTVRKFRTVQKEGKREVVREIDYYNLDLIISIGYRVNSVRGTQFRMWANKVLKAYLVKGYTINEKRLKEQSDQLEQLKQTVKLLGNVLETQSLNSDEATGLLKVITDYTYALDVLDRYDHQILEIKSTTSIETFRVNYKEAMGAIEELKTKFGGSSLFGNEKDESFKGSLAAIYQTFGGDDLYLSVEEKAAHLLYFVVKNHSFSDGNKRIAAFLFVWFLDKNEILYKQDGTRKIADNALVALTLMIAESKPEEKDTMAKVVVNLINKSN